MNFSYNVLAGTSGQVNISFEAEDANSMPSTPSGSGEPGVKQSLEMILIEAGSANKFVELVKKYPGYQMVEDSPAPASSGSSWGSNSSDDDDE